MKNPYAKDLRTPKYKMRVVKDKREKEKSKEAVKEIDKAKPKKR